MKTDDNLVLVLNSTFDGGGGYSSAHLRVAAALCYTNSGAIKRPCHPEGQMLSPHWTSSYSDDPFQEFADLQVCAALSSAMQDASWFGWSYDYRDVHHIDVDRAASMVKTLKRLHRGMDSLRDKWGAAPDFATYLTRFAAVIGCARYAEYQKDQLGSTGSHWRWMDTDDMRGWISSHEREFFRDHHG